MTTQRKKSQSIAYLGVKYIKDIVNEQNCIFQEISLENDIGNDAYIEFIQDEHATGCCAFAQIKSGNSYMKSNGNFVLKADKEHFEYWYSQILPIAGFVYNPTKGYAVWVDVTEYITTHPNIIETGPYEIEILSSQEFSSRTFKRFAAHFHKYLEILKDKLGIALEKFADIGNYKKCLDGFIYLSSVQRQNFTSWYYVISCFQNFRRHPLLLRLIDVVAQLPGNGDIFWHNKNWIQDQTREAALRFLEARFGRAEIIMMLEVVQEGGGFTRGAIGQCIVEIINHVKNCEKVLESIISNPELEEVARYWALLLLIDFIQDNEHGAEKCLDLVDKYKQTFLDEDLCEMLKGLTEEINRLGRFYLFV
jgi:hypothetical protein